MDHTHNQNYNNPDCLKAYCIICEFKHHVTHVGRANEIGLNEKNNNCTVISIWRKILRDYSEEEASTLYSVYTAQIERVCKKLGYDTHFFKADLS